MRLFYLEYPISEKASHLLSWSHYVELLKIEDKLERSFYEKQSILEKWSIPELKRQKKASLFLRLAASKDKEGILHLAKQGQSVSRPEDVIRDPYILDFLKIPELYLAKPSWKAGPLSTFSIFCLSWAKALLLLAGNTGLCWATNIIS